MSTYLIFLLLQRKGGKNLFHHYYFSKIIVMVDIVDFNLVISIYVAAFWGI